MQLPPALLAALALAAPALAASSSTSSSGSTGTGPGGGYRQWQVFHALGDSSRTLTAGDGKTTFANCGLWVHESDWKANFFAIQPTDGSVRWIADVPRKWAQERHGRWIGAINFKKFDDAKSVAGNAKFDKSADGKPNFTWCRTQSKKLAQQWRQQKIMDQGQTW